MKWTIVMLSPVWLRSRLHGLESHEIAYTAMNVCWSVVALAVGALTHIVWDAFTHRYGWGVELLPFLNTELLMGDFTLPGYKLLQYGSTVIGLPLVTIIAAIWIARQKVQRPVVCLKHPAKVMLTLGLLVIPTATGVFAAVRAAAEYGRGAILFSMVTATIGSFIVVLVVIGMAITYLRHWLADASSNI